MNTTILHTGSGNRHLSGLFGGEKFLHFDFPGLFIPLSSLTEVIAFCSLSGCHRQTTFKSAFLLELVLLLLVILRLRVRLWKIEDIKMTKFKSFLRIRHENRWVEISILLLFTLYPLPFNLYPLQLEKRCRLCRLATPLLSLHDGQRKRIFTKLFILVSIGLCALTRTYWSFGGISGRHSRFSSSHDFPKL